MMQENGADLTAVGGDGVKREKDFIDKVCDPCGLLPDNIDEAFAHQQKMNKLKEAEEAAAKAEMENNAAADEAVGSVLSNFDCCRNPTLPPAEEMVQDEAQQEFVMKDVVVEDIPEAEEPVATSSYQSRALADIAAKMDDIDLESGGEDIPRGQITEVDGVSLTKPKAREWYKEPLYACLIVLSATFSFAIFVMAILLIVRK